MNAQVIALLPLLMASATVILVMLGIAIRRSHALAATLSMTGTVLALASLAPGWLGAPGEVVMVTGLISVDAAARFAMLLILATTVGVLALCPLYMSGYQDQREELYLLITTGTVGALTLAVAHHAATLLLGFELLSLPLVAAIAYTLDRPAAVEGAVKYLVLSAAASATLLFGVALIYAQTGQLDLVSLAAAVASAGNGSALATTGALMILAGLAFKLSFVPFHQWTADVYEAAPLPVTAFLSTVVKLGAFAVALRLFHTQSIPLSPLALHTIMFFALASMLGGTLLAFRQENLKRLLAYSSIANFGFLAVLLALPGATAGQAAGVYLIGYVIASLGIFGVMTVQSSPMGREDLTLMSHYRGLFQRSPWSAAILVTMLLSLAGVPLTAGFIGKLAVLSAGVDAGNAWLVGGVILASAIGMFYYLRVVGVLITPMANSAALEGPQPGRRGQAGGVLLVLLMVATVVLGVLPETMYVLGRLLVLH